MADTRLKVGIIGAGTIANGAHIPAWKDQPSVEIVGVADSAPDNARSTALRHQIAFSTDSVQELLEKTGPDAVSICAPAHCHREHAVAALRSGAHVLCEKPLALTSADAAEMFREAERAKRHLLVGQSMRFYNQMVAAKDFAASGELGEIYCADAARIRRRGVPSHGVFTMKSLSGGGVLYDLGVHMLDTLLWIMGNPRVVTATGATFTKIANRNEGLIISDAESGAPVGVFNRKADPAGFDVEDMASAFLRLENGAVLSLRVSWAANVPDDAGGIYIMGTGGGLFFDPRVLALRLVKNMGRYQVDVTPKLPPPVPNHPFYAHWKEIAHFVRAIRGEEEPCVRRDEALNVLRALEAIYQSAAEGREVRLNS